MVSIGVLVKDAGVSQLNFNIIKNFNQFIFGDQRSYCAMFFENMVQPMARVLFPIFNIAEAYEWKETLIATSLSNAHKLIHFPACKNKLFYVWDLEWIRLRMKDYALLGSIYNAPNLKIIARSKAHADLLSEVWGCKVHDVVENFGFFSKILLDKPK